MSLKENVQQGLRSLATRRLRTILSTLGVMFGVVAVVTMLSIGEGAKRETLAQIEQLGMNSIIIRQNALSEEQLLKTRELRSRGLTQTDFTALNQGTPFVQHQAALKQVEAAVQATFAAALTPEILAVTDYFKEIKGLEVAEGRFLCALDIKQRQQVCVLGSEIAKILGKYGHAGQTIRLQGIEFKIVGVLKNRSWKAGKTHALTSRNLNKSLFIPLGVERTLPNPKAGSQDTLSEIIMQLSDSDKMMQTVQVIKRIMERAHDQVEDYQIIIPQELLNQANRTQYTFNLVLGSIAAISLLVGGIGIMNIMLATVSERTREIGIRRAVGANQRHIISQFLIETLLLTLIGAISGVAIGIAFSMLISLTAGWTTVVTVWSILLSMGMAVGVGACSGLYPAIKAARMNPITALRHDF